MALDKNPDRSPVLADYVAVLTRRKWLILLMVVLTTAGALFFSSRQGKVYEATATALLNPDASLVNGAGPAAADAEARFASGQAQIADTPRVALLAVGKLPAGAKVRPADLVAKTTVTSDPTSNLLTFRVGNSDPAQAIRLVNAYIDAYAEFSAGQLTSKIRAAIADESQSIRSLTAQIAQAKKANSPSGDLYARLNSALSQRSANRNDLNSVSAAGGAQVANYASSASQTEPQPVRAVAIGFGLGMVLSIGLAFLLEALGTKVRTGEEVGAALGVPPLGRLPKPRSALEKEQALAMLSPDASDSDSEPYRKLRLAVDFANIDLQARVLMVTSAVQQEGKSVTIANLAVAMAATGRFVTLVDLDLRKPTISTFFRIAREPGISDVALGLIPLDEATKTVSVEVQPPAFAAGHSVGSGGRLSVLPAGTPPPSIGDFVASSAVAGLVSSLAARGDLVLIDTPPMLPVSDAGAIAALVDGIVVVAKVSKLNRAALKEFSRQLKACRASALGYVLTGGTDDDVYGYGTRNYAVAPQVSEVRTASAPTNESGGAAQRRVAQDQA